MASDLAIHYAFELRNDHTRNCLVAYLLLKRSQQTGTGGDYTRAGWNLRRDITRSSNRQSDPKNAHVHGMPQERLRSDRENPRLYPTAGCGCVEATDLLPTPSRLRVLAFRENSNNRIIPLLWMIIRRNYTAHNLGSSRFCAVSGFS